jgi:hypothetical protein
MFMVEEEKCSCGEDATPKIFYVGEFQIRGSECKKCGKTFLNGDDVKRYAEYRKGINVAERVVC